LLNRVFSGGSSDEKFLKSFSRQGDADLETELRRVVRWRGSTGDNNCNFRMEADVCSPAGGTDAGVRPQDEKTAGVKKLHDIK